MKFLKRLIGFIAVVCAVSYVLYKLDERYEETKYIKIRKNTDIEPY